ncbi:MAG TPA: hypothetical protein VM890_00530, partial [Longimicrobium sp.]|nr:hypothetical protein [Longimicrobium sp.]
MSTPTIDGQKAIPSAGAIREPALADPALRARDADIPPDAMQAAAEYWKTTLSDAPELLELPTDHARP